MKKYYDENQRITIEALSLGYTVFLDECFDEPQYERDVLMLLNQASENDHINLMINSPGGSLIAGLPILMALRNTKAKTYGVLMCEAHSMASMLLLSCDQYEILPYCSSLIHSCSYGTCGKAADVKAYVDHTDARTREVFEDVYYGFLSEEEIEEVLAGKELYLNFDQICERLSKRKELFDEEQKEFLEETQMPPREELLKMTKKQILDIFMGEEG